jgi:hypothetical protein
MNSSTYRQQAPLMASTKTTPPLVHPDTLRSKAHTLGDVEATSKAQAIAKGAEENSRGPERSMAGSRPRLASRASPKLVGQKIPSTDARGYNECRTGGKRFNPSTNLFARMRSQEKGPAAKQGQVYGVEAPRGRGGK